MWSPFALCLALAPLSQDPTTGEAERIELERLPQGQYFLIGPRAGEAPERGYGLLVVLPGGDGGWDDPRGFLPFVENGILGNAAPEDLVGALGVAVRWRDDQEIVWPTQRSRVRGARWTTERYVAAVIASVREQWSIDPERIHLLAWSSSGPAAYELALSPRSPFSGTYVAMSVFRPEPATLPRARGRRFVLDQSPDDRVTPFRFAERAHQQLTEHGATVWLRRYGGGHGWQDGPLPRLASGLRWLDSDSAAPEESAPQPAGGPTALANGGFEEGTRGWVVLNNSGSTEVSLDEDRRIEGEQSLHLTKTGGPPLDLIRQNVDLEGAASVEVSAWIASTGARNAFVKFFAYDQDDEVIATDVDLLHVVGDRVGGVVSRRYDLGGKARYGVFMVVMVLAGEVWVDDVRVVPAGGRSALRQSAHRRTGEGGVETDPRRVIVRRVTTDRSHLGGSTALRCFPQPSPSWPGA